MSWDCITGDQRIVPTGTSGADEIRFESGKTIKVRLLLRDGEQPYSYLEHAIEVEKVGPDGKTEKLFRTIRCPKTASNPNAPCPICDGQRYRRRIRNAANVFDYESGKVQKLNAGDGIWKPIATCRKMGVDVQAVDWGLMKTGTDRNDTEYTAINLGPCANTQDVNSFQLFDVETDYAPHTIEEMKAIIESMGVTWEEAITPPHLQFPSLQEALDHIMPNGKHKGKTFAQLWQEDQTSKGMINYLGLRSDRITDEKACAQVILVNLGGANIPGVPRYNTDGTVAEMANVAAPTPTPTPNVTPNVSANTAAPSGAAMAPTPTPTATAPVNGDRQQKIDEINKLFSTKERFVKGGFQAIMNTLKDVGGGKTNLQDFTADELDSLVKVCSE